MGWGRSAYRRRLLSVPYDVVSRSHSKVLLNLLELVHHVESITIQDLGVKDAHICTAIERYESALDSRNEVSY